MATAQTQAFVGPSGIGGSGLLWNANKHKRAELLGLTVDNQSNVPQTIQLYDLFATNASSTAAAGATQAAEFLGTSNCLSGLIRLQLTVPAGQTVNLGKNELAGDGEESTMQFLGGAFVAASTTTALTVITAKYKMK